MTKTITFPSEAHLDALIVDLDGRWENRRDDTPFADADEDPTIAALDLASKWLAERTKEAAFPLTIALRDMPQAAADEVEISLEQLADLGIKSLADNPYRRATQRAAYEA